jgi:hypothetical protein
MRQNTRVTFAMRDLDRLKCIQAVVDGYLKPIRAADRLGVRGFWTHFGYRGSSEQSMASIWPRRVPYGDFRLLSVCGFLGSCGRRRFINRGFDAPVSVNSCRSTAVSIIGSRTERQRARRWCISTMRSAG